MHDFSRQHVCAKRSILKWSGRVATFQIFLFRQSQTTNIRSMPTVIEYLRRNALSAYNASCPIPRRFFLFLLLAKVCFERVYCIDMSHSEEILQVLIVSNSQSLRSGLERLNFSTRYGYIYIYILLLLIL